MMSNRADRATYLGTTFLFAGMITYGLFLLIYYLMASGEHGVSLSPQSRAVLDFVRIEKAEEVSQQKQRLPQQQRLRQRPKLALESLPKQYVKASSDYGNMQLASLPAQQHALSQTLAHTLNISNDFGSGLVQTQNIAPLVRVQPVYPVRAQLRGIEGWVEIKFAVDKNGSVLNPEVVAGEPASIFNSASLQAVSKWRYQARIVDGEAVMRPEVRVVIEYRLKE